MLALLAIVFGVLVGLCFVIPIVGIPLLLLGVVVVGFFHGYVASLLTTYKERQNNKHQSHTT